MYDIRPTCGEATPGPAGTWNCAPRPCGNGDREYIQTERNRAGDLQGFTTMCGLPDKSPQSLAIAEFYSTQVKVSTPMIAPKTTTLANFPNIYWSDVKTYEQNTDIQNANVRLKFIPVQYRWDFGDGETMTMADAGKPYDPGEKFVTTQDVEKKHKNTHHYTNTGTFNITLTIAFNGQYSVNGGGWNSIAGSITATSPPHPLTVYEARGELIAPPGN